VTGQVAEYFRQGGIFMWPLLFFSVLAATVAIERFIVFSKAKINVNEFLTKIRKALLVNRNVKEAIKVCEQNKSPVASVMKAGLLRYGQPRDEIEKTIENAALYELDRLEKRLETRSKRPSRMQRSMSLTGWRSASAFSARQPTWRPCSASWAPWRA